jgi:hypothetical protein
MSTQLFYTSSFSLHGNKALTYLFNSAVSTSKLRRFELEIRGLLRKISREGFSCDLCYDIGCTNSGKKNIEDLSEDNQFPCRVSI